MTDVAINGTAQVGQTLTGSYIYSDADGDPEGTSTFKWLVSDTVGGSYVVIDGATATTFLLTSAQLGKFIKFEVTPVATVDPTTGTTVKSAATIAVLAAAKATPEEELGPNGPIINEKPLSDYDKTNSGLVNLLYNRFLNRDPEEAGFDAWIAKLTNGALTGADLVNQFIFGKECQSIISNYTNEQFVTFLYKALFNREPDLYGFNAWLARMGAGMSKEGVVNGFTHSLEFELLCKNFSIKPYTNLSINVGSFHFYDFMQLTAFPGPICLIFNPDHNAQ